MHIPVPTCNGFILILIFDMPNEPLGITILYTRENLPHKVPHMQPLLPLSHNTYILDLEPTTGSLTQAAV
ncbi:hypothetical protein F383_05839 [Gossypium arboreum]|uniref:Uncharacterized protein n=1 Tax=Gossypium arboreum TaxID=29729 RepID=A0A0B0NT11_GOSAR|nr:hypothetical protein F383_05839 [Gossypium arboreum]